jgi:hypothetical protein
MNTAFNSLPWHDAVLMELLVDRRNAGERDEVRVRLAWPQGLETTIVFRDCYAMTADMYFGIIATERIGCASIIQDDPGLTLIRERWKPLGVSLESLCCYRIQMSSTGSVIQIYASQFEVVSMEFDSSE